MEQHRTPGEPMVSRPHAPGYQIPTVEEGLLSWNHVEQRLTQAHNFWLATTRPDGRPHVKPLWAVWVDGALYFDGIPTARWARNLATNPAAAVHLESGEDVVILEGTVEDLANTDAELGARVAAAYSATYGLALDDPILPQPATRGIFRLRPRLALAWASFPKDVTRWRFDGV
jgi:hypothetical protein